MRRLAFVLIAALVAAAFPAAMATAGDDDVIRRGGCSINSDWKLKLSPQDGGLEVEFEVDQNRAGQRWRVILKRDGIRFFRGIRTTNETSGSFTVRRQVSQSMGDFVGRARNLSSDELCRGSVSI